MEASCLGLDKNKVVHVKIALILPVRYSLTLHSSVGSRINSLAIDFLISQESLTVLDWAGEKVNRRRRNKRQSREREEGKVP